MELKKRRYRSEADYWRIRGFLREVFLLNDRLELGWQAYRFDYWRWHLIANLGDGRLEDISIWETEEGEIAAVLNCESNGQAFLQVHPSWRSPALVAEMVETAEETLAITGEDGQRSLCVWAHSQEPILQETLAGREYSKGDWPEYQRYRSLEDPIEPLPAPEGYIVRSLGVEAELLERCYASGLAFHPDDVQFAVENRSNPSWYHNIQNAPLYRRDLDLVVMAADGAVASFCTIWFDDVTRTGVFEPVGTVPAHQRRGLAKALMTEGLRRLRRLGATHAYVGSYEEGAHRLYASVGFTEYELSERWVKKW